jgi:hypothetical protein
MKKILLILLCAVGLSYWGWGQVVISQIYGGGGNTGAPYKNDFIELFNQGSSGVDLTGWSVQYASATGTSWTNKTNLTSIILAPGQYYLIQEAGGTNGVNLPTPDVTGTIAMSATAGKVALVNNSVSLTGSCPSGSNIIDFVGFGTTANCYEGTGPTPAPSNTTSVLRASNGCTDSNNNSTDFSSGAPYPRNTSSPLNVCSGGAPTHLAITFVNGGSSPISGVPFSVVVQSQDASNAAANVITNTDFTLSLATGTGTLGGILTGTIFASTNTSTITGVTYNIAENGVSITATRNSGDLLNPGTSSLFNVLPFVSAYRSKAIGNWNTNTTWEAYTGVQWIDAYDYPVSPIKDVTIQNGHTVTVPVNYNLGAAKNLTIENGATLYANASSGSCFVYVYGDILNNGTIGGATDVIGFDIEGTSCLLSGSGSFIAARIAKFTTANTSTNFTINQNVKLTYTSTTSAALRNGQATTTTFNIILNSGKQLTVQNAKIDLTGCTLTLKSDVSGTASLIDNGTIDGQSGTNATVERYLTQNKWQYVSAPVDNPTANVFFGIYMMKWDEPSGLWSYITDPNYLMATDMQGYAVWSQSGMTGNATVSFNGNLNTGTKSFNTTNTPGGAFAYPGFNFTGNPYPSSLDWDASVGWTLTNVLPDIWIWNQTAGNYGTYIKGTPGGIGTLGVTHIIPPHQGFFVYSSSSTGSISVDNGARIHSSNDILKSGDVVPDLLKLKVEGNNYSDEIILKIEPLASVNKDMMDAIKFHGSVAAPQFYSLSKDGEELSINSFPESEDYQVIPIGMEAGVNGIYTLTVNELDGNNPSGNIYLEDLKEGTFTKIELGSVYNYTASPMDEPIRFLLHLNGQLAVPENNSGLIGVNVYSYKQDVYITSENNVNGTAIIYDLLGREILRKNLNGESVLKINLNDHKGYMIVNVTTEQGMLNQKVYIR